MDHHLAKPDNGISWLDRAYAWACERLYYEFAWAYDLVSWVVSGGRWSRWRRAALDYLVAHKSSGQPTRTLELGFGTGELLIAMAKETPHSFTQNIFGLELSTAMQRVTRKKLRRHQLDIACVQASAQQIPYAANSFDNIISTFPAPYILDPSTLRECHRLLTTDGRLIIVGLWTTLEHPRLRKVLPIFYAEPDPMLMDQVSRRMAAADLHAEFFAHRDGVASVSIVVARRMLVRGECNDAG